jgi:hypothetical protein
MDRATVCIDFDQFRGFTASDIATLLSATLHRLETEGLVASVAAARMFAFGVRDSFSDPRVVCQLNLMQVQMRLVSSRKAEETDRQLERFLLEEDRDASSVVVVISSDQDFMAVVKKLHDLGKEVVVVHNAPRGSRHEANLSLYATAAWRHDDLLGGRAARHEFNPERHRQERPVEIVRSCRGRTGPCHRNESGSLYTFVTLSSGAAPGQATDAYLAASRFRGSEEELSRPAISVVVFCGVRTDASKLFCVAAFPESWHVPVDGGASAAVLGSLEVTDGLRVALGVGGARGSVRMCPAPIGRCEKGPSCDKLHSRHPRPLVSSVSVAAQAQAQPQAPELGRHRERDESVRKAQAEEQAREEVERRERIQRVVSLWLAAILILGCSMWLTSWMQERERERLRLQEQERRERERRESCRIA